MAGRKYLVVGQGMGLRHLGYLSGGGLGAEGLVLRLKVLMSSSYLPTLELFAIRQETGGTISLRFGEARHLTLVYFGKNLCMAPAVLPRFITY